MRKIDNIVEAICQSLVDVHFDTILAKSIEVSAPINDSQTVTIVDHDGDRFSIEIKKEKNE